MTDEGLTKLRKDAVDAWREAIDLTMQSHHGLIPHHCPTAEQIEVAFKFAITAQANYTLACWRKVQQSEGRHAISSD